jgi:hypothetical protein
MQKFRNCKTFLTIFETKGLLVSYFLCRNCRIAQLKKGGFLRLFYNIKIQTYLIPA